MSTTFTVKEIQVALALITARKEYLLENTSDPEFLALIYKAASVCTVRQNGTIDITSIRVVGDRRA